MKTPLLDAMPYDQRQVLWSSVVGALDDCGWIDKSNQPTPKSFQLVVDLAECALRFGVSMVAHEDRH